MKIRIDVGANLGTVSLPWLEDQDVVVYAFEPEPAAFGQLLSRSHNHPRYHCINKAISSVEGLRDFYVSVDPSSSSLLPYTEEGIKKWKCPPQRKHGIKEIIKVEAVTLYRFLEENNITIVDFLKVDAQGHDLEVIKSAENKIQNIIDVEFEVQITDFKLYEWSSSLAESFDYMKKMDFSFIKKEFNTPGQEINCYFHNNRYEKQ